LPIWRDIEYSVQIFNVANKIFKGDFKMNKRFKKVISSVLAAVMTMGVVGVANVSSVFAAASAGTYGDASASTNTDYVEWFFNSSSLSPTDTSDVNASKFRTVSANATTVFGESDIPSMVNNTGYSTSDTTVAVTAPHKSRTTLESAAKAIKTSNSSSKYLKITNAIPSGYKSYDVIVTCGSNGTSAASAYIPIYDKDGNEIVKSTTFSAYANTATPGQIKFIGLTDSEIHIAALSSQLRIYAVTLDYHKGDLSDYTITGSSTGLSVGDEFSIKNGDNDAIDVTVGENGVWSATESAESSPFVNGTYTVTPPKGYTVDKTSISISNSEDDTLTYSASESLTFTNVMATLTGTIASDLGATSVKFIDEDENEYDATVTGSEYSVKLPKDSTYSVSLLKDSGYIASQYALKETSVEIKNDTNTLDLTGEFITKWDFENEEGKTLPLSSFVYSSNATTSTYTYKGLSIDVSLSGSKFDASSNSRVQVNKNTVITVPMDTETQELKVTLQKNAAFDNNITVEGNKITGLASNGAFITCIEVVDKTATTVDTAKDNTAAYVTYDGNDYAIIVVPKDYATDGNTTKITLNFGTDPKPGPSEVYKNVQFGNKIYGADSFGGTSDDYVYGYAVTAASDSTAQAGIAAMTVTIE
jgi:hypothetical protein